MADRLEEYTLKRNFDLTREPEGERGASDENLCFVVQHHMARTEHYDFRLEWNGALLSWAVPKGPSYNPKDKRLAVQVEDHPLDYRNFEGTIPKGEYGGGTVLLWDEGFWEPQSNVEEGLRTGQLKFLLHGRRLRGKWALIRLRGKKPGDHWLLLKEKDEFIQDSSGIAAYTQSVQTGRTMAEIEADVVRETQKNPFQTAAVQLAKLVYAVPADEGWLYELKFDGYRILAFIEENRIRLLTRNGQDYTHRFKPVASALLDLAAGRAMVLDGEMTVINAEGKTDFQALQNFLMHPDPASLTYIVFDLLALDGQDFRSRRLSERKSQLEALMRTAPKNLFFSRHIEGGGRECFDAACAQGMEGIIGKRADSVYSGTRNGDWIKLKCDRREVFLIGGYTISAQRTSGFSALLLGEFEEDAFHYVGRAGSGLSEPDMRALEQKFGPLERKTPAFEEPPKPRTGESITWLEPGLVAEIKYTERTGDNLLRHASFKGLVSAPPVPKSGLTVQGVKVTHPDKVVFEELGISKMDVLRYYEQVAPRMLPLVSHRILSLVRCPNGVSQSCFFKKHPDAESPGIVPITVSSGDGKAEEYCYLEHVAGLLSEAQKGTLEFHAWGSRIEDLEKPDLMVFDLDPDEAMDLSDVRRGAEDLKSILSELSLPAYLKTSGGKGYHIIVPFKPSASWGTFYNFSKRIAEVMEQKWPDRYTSNVRKAKRTGRIFIDWIRNGRGATSVAPYSLRARKGAAVSLPIAWEELYTVAPNGIHMADALQRLDQPDPWKDLFKDAPMLKM